MSTRKRLAHWFSLIRTRLTLWIITLLAVGLLAFIITTLVISQHVVDSVDTKRSQQDVRYLAATIVLKPELSPAQLESLFNVFSSNDMYLQYQNLQGQPIASSTNMGRMVFPLAPLHLPIVTGHRYYLTANNRSWYIYGKTIVISGQVQGYLIAARINGTTDNDISFIFVLMYSGAFVMIAVIALLVWQLVRRTLSPLERLADSASQIAQTRDHSLRVYVQGGPDEINSLGRTINGMLHSLEEAYQHMQQVNDLQRRFLADASHELRTPLTIMLTSLELMKKERDPEFQANALENIQIEAQRMARLTTQLLLLARTDASASFIHKPLLIVDIISEACQQSCPPDRKINVVLIVGDLPGCAH